MNSKSVKEGGKHNMYSKSKRFIASFLAVLMAVCMLPADMLGGVGTVHAEAALTATFVKDGSTVQANNAVDSGTAITLAATDVADANHIVWSTSSDLTDMNDAAILAAWGDLDKKDAMTSDSISISGTPSTTVTLTAAAVKYTPAVEADVENNIEAADAEVEKVVDVKFEFTINKISISGATIALSETEPKAGAEVPTVTKVEIPASTEGGTPTVVPASDYDVTYTAGSLVDVTLADKETELKALAKDTVVTVKVTVKSTSTTYTGEKTTTYNVTEAAPTKVNLTVAMITVDGKAVTGAGTTESPYVVDVSVELNETVTKAEPTVVVKLNSTDTTPVAASEYTAEYANNTAKGTATVTVKPADNSTVFNADENGIVIQFTVTEKEEGGDKDDLYYDIDLSAEIAANTTAAGGSLTFLDKFVTKSISGGSVTVEGVSYSTAVQGSVNPTKNEDMPEAGAVIKLVAAHDGILTATTKDAAGKSGYFVTAKDGAMVNKAPLDEMDISKIRKFDVKEGNTYYLYVSGSKIFLYSLIVDYRTLTSETLAEPEVVSAEVNADKNKFTVTAKGIVGIDDTAKKRYADSLVVTMEAPDGTKTSQKISAPNTSFADAEERTFEFALKDATYGDGTYKFTASLVRSNEADETVGTVTKEVTIGEVAGTWTIKFMDGDTELTAKEKTVTKGGTYTFTAADKLDDTATKTFKGWAATNDADAAVLTEITPTEDTTVYAVWEDVVSDVIDEPTFEPEADEGTDSYTFPSKEGKVEIKLTKAASNAGAEIYYVLSTDTDTAKYAAFVDGAAASVYTTNGTRYEGIIKFTENVTIKAVAVKDDKASKVVTSPAYNVGTLDNLKGEIIPSKEDGSEFEADTEVKVTFTYAKDESENVNPADVKYLYKKDGNEPKITVAAAGTDDTLDGIKYTADGIVLDTSEEGDICIKVLAYTVGADNKVSAVSGVETFTYTVTEAAPKPHAITVDTTETNAKVTVLEGAVLEALEGDLVYISAIADVSEIKEGYKLNGWKVTTATNKPVDVYSDYDDDVYYYFEMPDEAVTVKADIAAKADCTVKLFKEDGTTQVGETKTLKEGDKYTFPAEGPTSEDANKYFAGWKNKNGTETYNPKDEIEVTENLEFVETWATKATGEDGKAKTFTVTFKNYDGDVIEKLTKTEQESGAVIDIPSEPVSKRTGYIFLGWSMSEEDGSYASVYEGNTYIVTNYNVTFTEHFTYEPRKNSGMEVRIDDDETYYTGKAVLPYIYVTYNGEYLTEGIDYTVKGKNNVNADGKKQPTFTITGKNNYAKANKKDVPFTIKKANIKYDCTYSAEMTVVAGSKVSPLIFFDATEKALKLNKDFTLSGADLSSKGKYDHPTDEPEYDETTGALKNEDKAFKKLTVTGINNFKGSFTIDVRVISKEAAKNAKLGVEIERGWKPTYDDEIIEGCDYFEDLFTGKVEKIDETTKKPVIKEGTRKITVYAKSDRSKTPLTYGEDYTVLVNSGYYRTAGTVKFTIVGMGKYTGNVSKSLKILPKKLESADLVYGIFDKWETKDGVSTPVMKDSPSVDYDPTGATPGISVYKKVTITEGTTTRTVYRPLYEYDDEWKEGDYKVTYSGNKKVTDKAKAKITFIGDYKGTKPVTVQYAITALPLQLSDEYGEGITVAAPDMVFSKAGKSYKAKPVVYYSYYDYNEDYESETMVTTQLKASDYTLSYEWASASKITVKDGKEEGYTDPDNSKVKVAIEDNDNCAVVRIKVTLKGNYTTAKKIGQDGKPVEGEEFTVYGYYRVWKSEAAKYDLSKAKVEFFKEYDNGEYKTPYKKGINFNNQEFYTPSAKYDEKTQKVIYEKPDEEESYYRQPVYVKVTVKEGKNNVVVPANLFDVEWYNGYGKGKANVIVTGKGTTPTKPNTPSKQDETGTGSEGGTTEPTVPDYAVGSKNASIKINPIGSWIEPAADGKYTVAGILKNLF